MTGPTAAELRSRADQMRDRAVDAADPRQADRLETEAAGLVQLADAIDARSALDVLEEVVPRLAPGQLASIGERVARLATRLTLLRHQARRSA